MARPNTFRHNPLGTVQVNLEPAIFWDKPEGIDLVTPLSRLGVNRVPLSTNMRVNEAQRYVTKKGQTLLGDVAGSTIVGQITASDANGIEYTVRVLTDSVEILSASTWIAATGPTLAIDDEAFIEFTAWGGALLFTDGSTGLYSITLADGTFELIETAPIGLHLTTFAGRTILSYILGHPTRIQWSTRNSNEDWSGEGSGYDDMLSSPGGLIDIQHGIVPLNDIEALVFRTGSVWIMSQTGNANAPFNFFQRFTQGTDAPGSIAKLPNQRVIMLGRDDVYMVTASEMRPLGLPVRSQLIGGNFLPAKAIGCYDPKLMEYRLRVPSATDSGSSTLWRWHEITGAWSRDIYPSTIRRIGLGDTLAVDAIEDLVGTIEAQVGTIEQLGVSGRRQGLIMVIGDNISAYEDDVNDDIEDDGTTTPFELMITSSLVQPGGPLIRATLVTLQIEYTATQAGTGTIEESTDGGVTWSAYGTMTFEATTVPLLAIVRRTIDKARYQFRLRATDMFGLEVIAATAYGQPGAPIQV